MSSGLYRLLLVVAIVFPSSSLAAGAGDMYPKSDERVPPSLRPSSSGRPSESAERTPGEVQEPEREQIVQTPAQPGAVQTISPLAWPAQNRGIGVAMESPIDSEHYVCGQGDVFMVNFWGQLNASFRFVVDASGRGFVPKVGYVEIAGKTLKDASADLRKAIARYYPKLSFDVSLLEPRTFVVHVVGAVLRPGAYVSRATERVSTALALAGGVLGADVRKKTGAGSLRRIEITRRDGTKVNADILLYNLFGSLEHNPFLRDGDVVAVSFEAMAANIGGAVQRPGRYELVAGRDIAELVTLAGGVRSTATRQLPIRVTRRGEGERLDLISVPFPAGQALPAFALRSDDRVEIPSADELQRSVLLVGAIEGASQTDEATALKRVPFQQGDTVRTLIERAGGVSSSADFKGSYILRRSGEEQVVIPLDLDLLLVRRDLRADHPIEMGDVITVPFRRQSIIVEGAVMRPGVYQFNPLLGILDYVTSAGGPTKMAQDVESYRVVSPRGKSATIGDKPVVRPGDTIVVPERHFSRTEVTQIIISSISLAIATLALIVTATQN